MTTPYDADPVLPSGFAYEEEAGNDDGREATEPGDELTPEEEADIEAEIRRPAVRRRDTLQPAASVLSGFYGDEAKRQYSGPPPRVRAVVPGAPVEAYTCPVCSVVCGYEAMKAPVGIVARLRFYTRPYCLCEQERNARKEAENALKTEADRHARIRAALFSARRALVLPPRLGKATFDNYDTDRHKAMKTAYMEVRAFTENAAAYFADRRGTWELLPEELRAGGIPEEPPVAPVILGATGRGKSHICAAACTFLAPYGVLCRFVNCGDWIEAVRKQDFGGTGNAGELFREAQDADVLVLDDMGMEHFSANNPTSGQTTLYRLINYRYERGLPTMATTGLTPEKLAVHYGERGPAILSRISVGPWLKIPANAPDGRSYGRLQPGGTLETGPR